jgi:hypothetical protein
VSPRTRPRIVGRLALAASLALGGCRLFGRPTPPAPPPETAAAAEWPYALRGALNAALVRDFPRADSVLRAFSAKFPGTPPAAETVFYRALFRLDPATESTTEPLPRIREARTGLDAYVAGGPTLPRYVEAVLLRRLAGHLDSLHATFEVLSRGVTATPGVLVSPGALAVTLRDTVRARDEEIIRLRSELEQSRAELDRIRRRLTPSRP